MPFFLIALKGYQEVSGSLTAIAQLLCFLIYLDNDLLFSSWTHIRALDLAGLHLGPPIIIFQGTFTALRLCSHLHTLPMVVNYEAIIDIAPKGDSFQHNSLHMLGAEAVARIIFPMPSPFPRS
ncbi:hypothetical protein EV702DRAFT_1196783 [Suillus placidus]|uniref:Uncharacterized protein n=1 Tax=Suillus placidus TaxID=48579 RepID=A0A9P6ZXJ3_9AGAM|nr:hypothetical protein EV702DRAFT_1196783 [Suillus placidus]